MHHMILDIWNWIITSDGYVVYHCAHRANRAHTCWHVLAVLTDGPEGKLLLDLVIEFEIL